MIKRTKYLYVLKRRTETINSFFSAIFFSFLLSKQLKISDRFLSTRSKMFLCVHVLAFNIFVFFCFVLFLRLSPRSAEKREGKEAVRVTEMFSFFLLYGSGVISKEEYFAARIATCNPVSQRVPTNYSWDSSCG